MGENQHAANVPNRNLHFDFSSVNSPCFRGIKANSPVTDLVMNLGELSTKYNENTPRRKLSLCSSGTPTPVAALKPRFFNTQLSLDDGCCLDSPSPDDFDSPFSLERFGKPENQFHDEKCHDIPSQAFKRFQSMPVPFCGFDPSPPNTQTESRLSDHLDKLSPPNFEASPLVSPGRKRSPLKPLCFNDNNVLSITSPGKRSDDDGSQDSGVCLESKDSEFKFPIAPAPRSMRLLSDESRSPHRYSPSAKNAPKTFKDVSKTLTGGVFKQSPLKLRRSSITSSDSDDGIDLLDFLDDADDSNHGAPAGMASLLHSRVLDSDVLTPSSRDSWSHENQENIKPTKHIRRGLFRSPSAPRLFQHKSHTMHSLHASSPLSASPLCSYQPVQVKRSEPCSDDSESTPRVSKRRKSVTDDCLRSKSRSTLQIPKPDLHRCQSESEAIIKTALNRQASCPDLVGDMSRSYCLPLCSSKHDDLKGITPDTLAGVLRGEYDHIVEKCIIVDSRYPYEYEGGHIKGAKNLYTREQILEEFYTKSDHKLTRDTSKRTIIVFHCEFSSERGPKMSRFLRSHDRQTNKELYPFLNYPEIYLLENGYKRFFEEEKSMCVPETYKPMLHEAHEQDLKHFRAKSKSWAGERGGRGVRSILRSGLKF